MHCKNLAVPTVLICAALLSGTALAATTADANNLSCMRTAKEVRAALDNNKNSPNYQPAMVKRNQGLVACNSGFYKLGMAHYTAALKLLGSTDETNLSPSQ